jgi:uncharacterized protein (DUF1501 family)
MMFNRRQFLSAAAAAAIPQFSVNWARASAPVDRSLVVVFLRGGMDVLNLLAPVDDKAYVAARPVELRVQPTGENRGMSLGDMAGGTELLLNPAAKPLHHLWQKKQLALIPAAGLNNATRSHFQAMDLMERGVSTDAFSLPRDGWLTRLVAGLGRAAPGSTLCLGGAMPQSLSLCETALPISDVWDVDWMPSANFRDVLVNMHSGNSSLDRASRQAIEATGFLAGKLERDSNRQPTLKDLPKGIAYPDHDFGNKLRFLAEMMRVNPDIQLATADLNGWDMHDNQASQFSQLAATMAASLLAFHDHLDSIGRPTTIVVMSEFGRRVKSNESGGTDHGHGGLMMVMGDQVNGGQIFGRWPGLVTEQLDEGMDLAVTTDFRDVLASILLQHGAGTSIASVFPQHEAKLIEGLFRRS